MKRRLVAVAILISLVSWPAFGWQEDLHYGLSKWLAYKAGFSLNDAETIAIGVQSLDDGPLYPAVNTVILLSSSVTLHLGHVALERGRKRTSFVRTHSRGSAVATTPKRCSPRFPPAS